MAVFTCEMCGGTLEVTDAKARVGKCLYCGLPQTLPKDSQYAEDFIKGNDLRRSNEYDEAIELFEEIRQKDDSDAKTYWSKVLCTYGVEYVVSPDSQERIPTVHRAQFTSIFEDEDYKKALSLATSEQRALLAEEARKIDVIQKGILKISRREEPFDVFICYKEEDEYKKRTEDSVIAMELYDRLTEKGLKVFFARVTLESRLGQEYEPYIFAALNSAKVMVVVGTRLEYINAVWVKNEWSRFLKLQAKDKSRVLIPVYRGIDPGTLPEGLKELQALDMEKLGYMQDLVHGIQKFTGEKEKPGTEKTPENAPPKIEKWLKRTFLLLEEGNFESAEKYCNQVLDEDPENAGGYLAKLLLERKVKTPGELSESGEQKPLDDDLYYQRILRYGDEEQKAKILSVNQAIHFRVELEKKEERYHEAIALMEEGSRSSVEEAAEKFEELSGYRDSIEKAEECRFNLETKEKDPVYENAVRKLEQSPDDELVLNEVLALLERIRGWKDTDHLLDVAGQKLKDLKEKEEKERQEQERKRIRKKRKRRRRRIVFLLLLVLLAAGLINEWKPVLWPYVSENEDLKTVRTFAEEKLPKEMTSLLSENKSVYARQNVSLYLPGDNTFKETEAGEGTIKFISSYDYVGQALSEALKLSLEEGDVISVVHEYQEGLGAMFDMDTEDIVKAFENAYGYQKDVDYRIVSSMMDKAGRCTGIAYTVNYLGDAVQEASRVKHFRVFISEGEFYGIEADINSENNVKNEMIKASLDSFSLAEESDLKTAIDTLQKRFGLLSPEE